MTRAEEQAELDRLMEPIRRALHVMGDVRGHARDVGYAAGTRYIDAASILAAAIGASCASCHGTGGAAGGCSACNGSGIDLR